MQALFDNASDAFFLFDDHDTLIDVNPAATVLTGYSRAEMADQHTRMLSSLSDEQRMELWATLRRDGRSNIQLDITRKDGSKATTDFRAIVGIVPGVNLAIVRDITEQLKAQSELKDLLASQQALTAHFRLLLESTAEGIFGLDIDGRCTFVNQAAAEVLGFTAEEIVGYRMHDLVHHTYPDGSPHPIGECMVTNALRTGTSISTGEEIFWRKDGTSVPVHYFANPLVQDGSVTGIVVTFRDVTDQLRVAAEREETLVQLRNAVDERGRLYARLVSAQEEERVRIAGDLHDDSIQVMAAVAMWLGLLRRHTLTAETEEVLTHLDQTVAAAIKRLRRLLFELRPPSLDEEGLEAAMRLYLDEEDRGSETSIEFKAELTAEPPPQIRATLYRIAQEALTNVRRHAKAKHLVVELRTFERGTLLTIGDDGVGFASDEASILPGHLGLLGVQERADEAGGWLKLTSVVGKGTTVECWLPSSRLGDAA